VPVIVELVLLHGNTRYVILVDVIQTLANLFRRLEQRLREIGSATLTALVNAGCPRTVRTPANEYAIIAAVEREPWRNSRDIAREFGLFQPRVLKYFMTINCIHTTHYSLSAHLFPDDRPLRMQFCEWLRHQRTADELFLHNILWTDEACFTREGVFNVHNSHLWTRDNPHVIRERGIKSISAPAFGLVMSGTLSWAPICYLIG
jgi:hypothetical protein